MTVGLSLGVEELAYGAPWLVRDLGGKLFATAIPPNAANC